ncbi:M28 family metallopeptidase [Flocculibacter collagenilyticus]|uniref:M28 family metallopeptidase n=1 Tax=Flocculibacter collagenilyticus TaxID=2744479 RepID=UPI0018F6F408|nr:M28 family metallopeptidase [Flocculibacter collagenilyticus]
MLNKPIYHAIKILCILITGIIFLAGCNESNHKHTPQTQNLPDVNANNIKAHLSFLASDDLEGRDVGSVGHNIASNYVASEFQQLGLTPAGDNDTYFQNVPLRKAYLTPKGAELIVHQAGGDVRVNYPKQFLAAGSGVADNLAVSAEAVFVGYGMVSERFGINDYDGLDVDGKIVVALAGRPKALPSEEGAHLQSGYEKKKHAVARGAVGFISIHTPKREKVRSYASRLLYLGTPSVTWLNDNKPHGTFEQLKGSAYINTEAAKHLFSQAEKPLTEVFEAEHQDKAIKGFPLNTKITLKRRSYHKDITSPNVAAVLEGSDPILKNEYVVFSAHSDHIGLAKDITTPDRINNGALDNASGVAILLETARLLSQLEQKPKRSILFVVVTGEEKGLLGSSYYANNPTVPIDAMVANVNLDMPLILFPFADVIAFGANHSTMGPSVERAANKLGLALSPDPMPEQALFTRSDHYNFVKKGIPSVFLMTGMKSKDPSIEGGKVWGDFLKTHYHKPSDQLDLPISYEAAADFAKVNMMIGLEVANAKQRPTWVEGDFFGEIFTQTDKSGKRSGIKTAK